MYLALGVGGAVAAQSHVPCLSPRAPAACAAAVPVVPVPCVPVPPSPKSRALVERTGCVQHLKSENVWGLAAEPNGSAGQSDPEAMHIGARGDPQLKVTHGRMQRDVEVHGQKQSVGRRPAGEDGQAVGGRCPGQHNSYIRQCQVSTARHDDHTIVSMMGARH